MYPSKTNDILYDSSEDLSYFNFPRDKQKRKGTPSLECISYFSYIVNARQTSLQIQNGGCGIRVYCTLKAQISLLKYSSVLIEEV